MSYERELNRLVDELFRLNDEKFSRTWDEFAAEADLSVQTVRRLAERVTRLPRLLTVQKLAKAVDMQLAFVNKQKQSLRIRRAG